MTTIYLIRHGEAEGNLYRRCQGHYNSLITDNGFKQINALAKRFEDIPIDAVYSSDLFRATTTAKAICKPKGLKLFVDPRLREVGTGEWEDVPWGALERQDSESLSRFTACDESWSVPGSDTYPGVRTRMRTALSEIAARHEGQTVAVISHGSAIRTFVSSCMGLPIHSVPHCDNTAVAKLEAENGNFTVIYQGDNSHLSPEISTFARQSWWRENSTVDSEMWFRPLNLKTEADLYSESRKEAWIAVHKTLDFYDGDKFLRDAKKQSDYSPNAVMAAMLGDEVAGILQLDIPRDADKGIGGIPFCYMAPKFRCKKMGVQLIGQAVSTYRNLGRCWLRLRCAPDNARAQHFYQKYGFKKAGMAQLEPVPLELLDKYIGFDESMYADKFDF